MSSKANRSFISSQARLGTSSGSSLNHSRKKRSTMNFSNSRRSIIGNGVNHQPEKMEKPSKFGVVIFDEDGNDVTPKPLYNYNGNRSQILVHDSHSNGTATDGALSFASLFQTATQSVYAQPFSRSIYNSDNNRSIRKSYDDSSTGGITEPAHDINTAFDDVTTIRREVKEVLTEKDLEKIVNINLDETDTIWLFEQEDIRVSTEADESNDIRQRNVVYEELCKEREGNDRYCERGMQTFNLDLKNKDVQANKVGLSDNKTQASNWDMYDTYNGENIIEEKRPSDSRSTARSYTTSPLASSYTDRGLKSRNGDLTSTKITESRVTLGISFEKTLIEDEPLLSGADDEVVEVYKQWQLLSENSSLSEKLLIMERIVTENIYQPKLAVYRGLPVYLDIDDDSGDSTTNHLQDIPDSIGPTIKRLWSFNCPLTMGKNVSCMTWNKKNPNLLAVGYGSFNFVEQNKTKFGIVCCWNLKNLEFPERIYHCKASISAVDFSNSQPNLLAVGCTDGTVCIFNTRSSVNTPTLDSFDCPGKHSSPVWQLKWIEREQAIDVTERLVSVAADGRVVDWSIRKGLECTDLMKLKRNVAKPNQSTTKKKDRMEALLSRHAPGMSFDFHPNDASVYLAGTEEGMVHKCSCSYNEQFLDTYVGHTGSVYKVKWSPFADNVFLSCSSDWSIRVWDSEKSKPALNLLSTTKAVHDICWSPFSSTVFCVVNEGAAEIWDLAVNILDPVIINPASPPTELSSCIFSQTSNSVLIGDTEGNVTVYQLKNIGEDSKDDKKESLKKIVNLSFTDLHKKESLMAIKQEDPQDED